MTAVNPSTEGLSKSQKKRLKQKAKKQKEREAQQAADFANINNSQNGTFVKAQAPAGPNSTLVETLLEQGFTREQISKAQEQLWEAVGSGEGGYDDVWAVSDLLVHLYGGGGGGGGAGESDEEDDSDNEEESEEGSESEDSGEYEEESDLEEQMTEDNSVLGLKEEENTTSTNEDTATKNQEKQDEPQSRLLFEKLQYVAQSVPQLADALFALTEWTTKSASRTDLESYFLELNNAYAKEEDSSEMPEGPLRTIIQKVLLFQPQQQQHMDPSTLVTACANLLTCVLLSPACNVNVTEANINTNGAAHSTTMRKALGELLRRGRVLAAQFGNNANKNEQMNDGPTPEEVASSISNTILDLLKRAALEKARHERSIATAGNLLGSNTVDPSKSTRSQTLHFTSQAQAQKIVRQMEGEIASLMVKIVNKQRMPQHISNGKKALSPASLAVVDLISNRDRTKQIAEKSGVVLEVSAGCKKCFENGNDDRSEEAVDEGSKKESRHDQKTQQSQPPPGKYQSEESKEAFAQKIVGAPFFSVLAASVEEVKSYEVKVDRILSDVATEQINLSTRQTNVSFKRAEISKRMEQLRRELEELERQDELLVKEEKEVSSELERLERESDEEIDTLKAKIAAKSTHVAVDREVKRTVEKLGELESAWIRSSCATAEPETAAVPAPEPARPSGPPITELLPIKLDQYLNRARSYFQSESQCVEFLRNRVSSTEAEVLDLERELQECTMLGMTNNVETMTLNLRDLKAHVDEDNVVIDALRGDAKAMRTDLIRRVEEYMELMQSGENATEVLTPSHVATLEGISIELTGIGFYDDQDGGLANIFSKIPKRGCAAQSTQANDERTPGPDNDNSSYIGTVDGSIPSPLTTPLEKAPTNGHSLPSHVHASSISVVMKPPMPKFNWASKANDMPKHEKKSLLDIQREEMSAKEKN